MSSNEEAEGRPLVSYRTLDIAVTFFFLIVCAIVTVDSVRLGIAWKPNEGPMPGLFPFYMVLAMGIASLFNLWRALPQSEEGSETAVTSVGLGRMAAIFVPAVIFVLATNYIGIYVSATIYIGAFMIFFGKFPIWKAAAVSLGIAIVNFMMFEVWFLVPLPKGPLEAALGY
ncbi:tripartite tricarboxylate transporter TctB family protein [Bosea caraganae]|uniref:Tripartite tricarboxylate transporter TctB family protein n=1 Tax=Bosea caraganae TaxID=2763117 RepID=A0A370LBP7_9HYPH|nr:tripartite tricarboxylate transporter TctB family protein [Bosea caraganae]RDJ27381.1 tripartite tricarboxylate transporter TctB family protein [Bosea caraganae]RDJ29397.1 tripartite tricarboxylate transporter TctB family protein [Bosea caraganae]